MIFTSIPLTHLYIVLTSVELTVCQCRPAPDQLLLQGLFPCSPIQPSLAVDMKLLELISASSTHLALNMTGWASLLEQFWDSNGFSLKSKVFKHIN
jgi:hypothetical protein